MWPVAAGMTETIRKTPPTTEASIRAGLRAVAKGYEEQDLTISGEIIGLACEITGVRDPKQAITEVVEDALRRWSRLQVLNSASILSAESPRTSLKKSIR